jgi:signal peptidase I
MRRRRRPELDDESEESDAEVDDDEPSGPPRARHPSKHRGAPKAWSLEPSEKTEDAGEDEDGPGWFHRSKRPVFFRARDAWWFEPLIALMIIIVLLVGLFAYTNNWPPMYVVESSSMQHGTNDAVGLINTGDLVLAQQVPTSSIVPYVVGAQTGYRTYGEFGDVLLYHPDGVVGPAPIVHRAIVYLEHNLNGTFNVPQLGGLPCGHAQDRVYYVSTPSGCGTTGLRGNLTLFGVGWQSVSVNVTFADLGGHSGFLTMGDNNINPGTRTGDQDQPGLSSLVEPAWVVGVARGMVPWVGAVKLLLSGDATQVPPQSWQFLGLSIVALFLLGAGIHYALRAEGVEDERRKALEEEAAAEPEPPSRWKGLRGWLAHDEEPGADPEEPDEERLPPRKPRKPGRRLAEGGRPKPSVRRGERHGSKRHGHARHDRDDASDL